MPDLSEFRLQAKTKCKMSKFLEELDPEDAEKLQAALEEPDITVAAIRRFLERRGKKIGDSSIRRHRDGACND